jgi:hypothetical protein
VKSRVTDLWIAYSRFFRIIFHVIRLVASKNPRTTFRLLKQYPWLLVALPSLSNLYFKHCQGRQGSALESITITMEELITSLIDYFESTLFNPDRVVLVQDVLPHEIFHAMGLYPFQPELPSLLLPLLSPLADARYIDRGENYGLPADICSLHKSTIGMVLEKEMVNGRAAISSNTPCDLHVTTYTFIEKQMDIPVYKLDVPYHFKTKRASEYFVHELKEMIKWLESNTPGRMDWDRLRQICLTRNEWAELQFELWETLRVKPAPIAGESVWFPGWVAGMIRPHSRKNIAMFKKLLDVSMKNISRNTGAVPGEKHRVLLWNMPVFHFMDLAGWAETNWNVAIIAEGLAYNRIPLIDTASPDTMLEGLARFYLNPPMGRHSRGTIDNYIDDMFYACQQYKADMVWVGANIGCKKTMALFGIVRELCREKNMPVLFINMDVVDPRPVDHDMIKEQINHFMENIMVAGQPVTTHTL